MKRWWERIEAAFDVPFGAVNPLRHLGGLCFFLFWIVAATGIYAYATFDTSVAGAWRSVEAATRDRWIVGGVVRSLHRYASDALVATVGVHLLAETAKGHFRGFRWFSWLSGVPLVWLVYACGIGGYWLVWDRLAQYSLTATMEWLDCLPLFSLPLVRNFLGAAQLTDRLFSLLVFLHIGIPLLLLLGMWIHIQRISYAAVSVPRALGTGTLVALTGLSLARPAVSHAPADLATTPSSLAPDWWYLFVHPLADRWSPGVLWWIAVGVTLALALIPWGARKPRSPVAVVDLANCNGCARCANDCPYAAVVMRERSDGRAHPREAAVLADLCAGCGICVGACPSSTPFRSVARLSTGIDLPRLPIDALRSSLEARLDASEGPPEIVVFGCDRACDAGRAGDGRTAVWSLPCIAMLPPAFVEFALRRGVRGVLLTGCPEGGCEFRLGNRWAEERLGGTREPHLRVGVDTERVATCWAGPGEPRRLRAALEELRTRVGRHEKDSEHDFRGRA